MKLRHSFKVTNIPGLVSDEIFNAVEVYAGLLNIDNKFDGALFFWLFKSIVSSASNKLFMFFNGGPGCSSMDGLLLEYGPLRITTDGKVYINEDGRIPEISYLFIDQPVQTGYSYLGNKKGKITDIKDAAKELGIFFKRFLMLFPEFKDYEVYLSGESYAGTYLPYFYYELQDMLKVKGIIANSPWIDYRNQYLSFVDYSKQVGLLPNSFQDERVESQMSKCSSQLDNNPNRPTIRECDDIVEVLHQIFRTQNNSLMSNGLYVNQYKIDEYDSNRGNNWPKNLDAMTQYFRMETVKKSLNVVNSGSKLWSETNGEIFSDFSSFVTDKPAIEYYFGIAQTCPILIIAGEYDLVSNYVGLEKALFGNQEFERHLIIKDSGWMYQNGNISYVLVKKGSHMLGVDKPASMKVIFSTFLSSNMPSLYSPALTDNIDSKNDNGLLVNSPRNSVYFWYLVLIISLLIFIYLRSRRTGYNELNRNLGGDVEENDMDGLELNLFNGPGISNRRLRNNTHLSDDSSSSYDE